MAKQPGANSASFDFWLLCYAASLAMTRLAHAAWATSSSPYPTPVSRSESLHSRAAVPMSRACDANFRRRRATAELEQAVRPPILPADDVGHRRGVDQRLGAGGASWPMKPTRT